MPIGFVGASFFCIGGVAISPQRDKSNRYGSESAAA
jgi:hypothetical protein